MKWTLGAAGQTLGIQRANMVSLIDELVDAGWVDCQVDGDDRRAFALTMTDAARATLIALLHRIERRGEG